MGLFWAAGWFLFIVFLVDADETEKQQHRGVDVGVRRGYELWESLLGLLPGVTPDLVRTIAALYLPVQAPSGSCRSHSEHVLQHVLQADPWALAMIDASSKLVPGLLDGHIQDLGNYDQCMRVQEPDQKFIGQHCVINAKAKGILPSHLETRLKQTAVFGDYPGSSIMFSVCVPSTCTVEDLRTHLNCSLTKVLRNFSVEQVIVSCSTSKPLPFRAKDWAAIGVFAAITILVVLSTWYESMASGSKSELLAAFSVTSNWRALSDTQYSPFDIPCLSGLRVIYSCSVVLTHRIMHYALVPCFNHTNYLELRSSHLFAYLASGHLATEIIFLIAGVVRSYSFLKERHLGKPLNILQSYLKRYFRVMPSLALCIIFSSTLYIHVSSGPIWRKWIGLQEDLCNNLWWSSILHISNIFRVRCRLESWFLAADFQLYILSPLLLIPLYFRPWLGLVLLAVTFTASVVAQVQTVFVNQLHPDWVVFEGPKMNRGISSAHHNVLYRVATFIMGLYLGYLLFNAKCTQNKITFSKRIIWMFWLLSGLALGLIPYVWAVFLHPDYEDSAWLAALYLGLGQRIYVVAVAWVVFACTLGHGGWVGKMLSWSKLRPLARLTFGLFILHPMIQSAHLMRIRQAISFDIFNIVHSSLADLLLSTTLAVVLFLTVENPCSRLVSYVLSASQSSREICPPPTYFVARSEDLIHVKSRRQSRRSKSRKEKKKEK